MSNRALYSINAGGDKTTVVKTTDGAGGGTPAVQIIVDQGAVALDKMTIMRLIELCQMKIIEDTFPEA